MNIAEARQILQTHRPDSVDSGDASYAEALALVATDPGLRAWYEREQQFNRALAAGQEAIAVPAGLRERILAARRKPAPVVQPDWRRPAAWWSLAACLAVLSAAVVAKWPLRQPAGESALASFALADAQKPKTHGGHGPEEAELKATLKLPGTQLGPNLQVNYQALHDTGCRVVQVEGRDVLEVCFRRNGVGLHYYIARRQDFPTLQAEKAPQVVDKSQANLVVWADAAHLYFVVTTMERAQLEKLL